jgi:hypothetical protein
MGLLALGSNSEQRTRKKKDWHGQDFLDFECVFRKK